MKDPDLTDKEYSAYKNCRLCPRNCGADRTAGAKGFCGSGTDLTLACVTLHKGEEPPLAGESGSGAFFFTGCTLQCPFCQNGQISRNSLGKKITLDDFAELCLTLQERGAENINLVTPTHFIPSLAAGLRKAFSAGLRLPVLWNSSGYEKPETLALVDPYVSIYLPDCKTLDRATAARLLHCPEYPEAAERSIRFMAEKGKALFSGKGALSRGLIVRHLAVPGFLDSTRGVIEWFSENLKDKALFSLMVQYLNPEEGEVKPPEKNAPYGNQTVLSAGEQGWGKEERGVIGVQGVKKGGTPSDVPRGSITGEDYDLLLSWLDLYGIEEGFIQEPEIESQWLPDFYRTNPFPSDFSQVIWHWRDGYSSE